MSLKSTTVTAVIIGFVFFASTVTGQNCGGGAANCTLRCQDDTGAITANADVCADQLPDCAQIFNCTSETPACEADPKAPATPATVGDPSTNPKVRSDLCDYEGMQDKALQCARTCLICCETPEYNCEDDDSGTVDCELNKGKCRDSNWTQVMSQYCPATCGLCNAGGSCSDLNSQCADLKTLCKNVDWYDYMQTNCAKTCEACSTTPSSSPSPPGSGTCSDIATNCAENSNLCTNTVYKDLMAEQCCATCGGNGGGSCTDSSTSCTNWNSNGFCSNSFYTTDQKRSYCAKTCGLC